MDGDSRENRRSIRELAEELLELAPGGAERLIERVTELSVAEQADLALRLPPDRRLAFLLHAPKPMRLIRSLPAQDLYMTVREVGPADALPALALASPAQLHHLLDLESWRVDRFDADRAGAWVALLVEAGEPPLRRFLRSADDETLTLLLAHWARLEPIEFEDTPEQHGHGQTEAGDERGFVTPDGNYRFNPTRHEQAPAIGKLLQLFFLEQRERYGRLAWESTFQLESELEEEALRWRTSRLEEHGFLPRDEAESIYHPPADEPVPPAPTYEVDSLGASRAPLALPNEESAIPAALERLDPDERDGVLAQITAVANRLIVADSLDTGDPGTHRAALASVAGYVQIALEQRRAVAPGEAAELFRTRAMIDLFREGYEPAAELAARARRLQERGWLSEHAEARRLLDWPIDRRIAALLERRPASFQFNEIDQTESVRPFRSSEEIDEARVALEMAELLGFIFVVRLGLELDEVLAIEREQPVTFSTLYATLLAWQVGAGSLRGDPLPHDVVARFLREVVARASAAPDAGPRAVSALNARLESELELSERNLRLLESFGRFTLGRVTEELGGLDPDVPADPRYIGCLLLTPRGDAHGGEHV